MIVVLVGDEDPVEAGRIRLEDGESRQDPAAGDACVDEEVTASVADERAVA